MSTVVSLSPRKSMGKKYIFGTILLFVLGIYIYTQQFVQGNNKTIAIDGKAFVGCFVQNYPSKHSTSSIPCVQETVRKLLAAYSAKEILGYISSPKSPDIVTQNCHLIAHSLGQENYKKARSMEKALSQCTQACNFGCIHGTIGEGVLEKLGGDAATDDIAHANEETILQVGEKYCKEGAMCHAMGHILFTVKGSYDGALGVCRKIAEPKYAEVCFEGVFMESLGAESSLVFRPSSDTSSYDYTAPCAQVEDAYKHACMLYLPNFQEKVFEKQKIVEYSEKGIISSNTCLLFSPKHQRYCFKGLGHYAAQQVVDNPLLSQVLYKRVPNDSQAAYLLGQIGGLIEAGHYAGAFNYCTSEHIAGKKEFCFDVAFQNSTAFLSPHEIRANCALSKKPQQCLDQFSRYKEVQHQLPAYGISTIQDE